MPTIAELKALIVEKGQGAVTLKDLESIKTKKELETILKDYEAKTSETQTETQPQIQVAPTADFPLGGLKFGAGGSITATSAIPPKAIEKASKKGYFQGRGNNLVFTDEAKGVLPYLFPPPEGESYVQEKTLADCLYVFLKQIIGYPLKNSPRDSEGSPWVVDTDWIANWRKQLAEQQAQAQ